MEIGVGWDLQEQQLEWNGGPVTEGASGWRQDSNRLYQGGGGRGGKKREKEADCVSRHYSL